MTEPPDDGVGPSPTRAERRAQRSRRARRQAERRSGSSSGSDESPAAEAPTAPGPVADRPAPAPTAESVPPTGPTRRERRTGGRRARKAASTPSAPDPAPVPAPPPVPPPQPPPAPVPPPPSPDPVPVPPPVPPEPAPVPLPPVEVRDEPDALPAPVAPSVAARADDDPVPVTRRDRRERPAKSRTRPPKVREPRTKAPRPEPTPKPARVTARPAVSNRTLWLVVIPLIVIGLVAAMIVGDRLRSDDADRRRAASRELAVDTGAEPTLMVHRALFGNDLIAITGRDGRGGGVLMVPPSLRVDVLGDGVATLRGLAVDDGGAQLTTVVENLLGVRIGRTVVLDDAALTAALGPAAPVPVDLGDEVRFSDRPARYRAGQQGLSAAQAAELMTAPQPGSELEQMVDAGAVFSGWLDRLGDARIAKATLAVAPDLGALVKAASAPDRRVDTLPVESLGIGGSERYVVKPVEATALVARMFPDARVGRGGRRARTEIYNGVGALGVASAVADKVVPVGVRVVRTDNVAGFGVTQTQIVYYQDDWQQVAQDMVDAMGCGSLRRARPDQDLGIADVTIIVGSDCPAYAAPGGAR